MSILHIDVAIAQQCVPPEKPFVPSDDQALKRYADLIQQSFESYLTTIQDYFMCLDRERQRAFEEAEEVTRSYQQFRRHMDSA
ncbi:hypothetical protein D8780_15300 [Notoacmeibacter ruber]|uniref:Uncharacterized protein n=1 Tax=Notoacmeibacter ruber TaxID=2670375 RepID=A0A3L7J916_9HYPH|nr:hypothetical protein D8780_15300 [Notoacmeibacter ruber]